MANIFDGFSWNSPELAKKRNIFKHNFSRDTSANLGEIKPVAVIPTMPASTYDLKKIATQTIVPSAMKHPLLSQLYQDVHIFYVPARIVWKHYKNFEGNDEPTAWNEAPQGTYSTPQLSFANAPVQCGDIGHTMGLPYGFNGVVSALPFRAFAKVYNYFYRDENVEVSQNTYYDTDVTVARTSVFGLGAGFQNNVDLGRLTPFALGPYSYSPDMDNKNAIACAGWCPHAYKLRDFFQTLLPKPLKGLPVTVSLSGMAPVDSTDRFHTMTEPLKLGTEGVYGLLSVESDGNVGTVGGTPSPVQGSIDGSNLWADLSSVSVISIDELTTAFNIQKVMHKLAHSGTRYDEWLLGIFGERVPDFRIDEPECIGGFRRRLNVGTVLQSSNANQQDTPTGTMYGFSNSVNGKDRLGQFTSKERGYIIVCSVIRTDNQYSQGLNAMWTRKTRFDYAYPPLANLPDEAHYKREVYWSGNTTDNETLGFSERYGSYKYTESRVSGMLDPNAEESLSNWTASEVLTSAPTLSVAWKKSIGTFFDRALVYPHFIVNNSGVVTDTGPDQFIMSFYFESDHRLPLPIHTKPYRL